jgi:hypothetical protein
MSVIFTFVLVALKGALVAIGDFFAAVYKAFGTIGIVCVGLIITNVGTVTYYEGVPLIKNIWYIGDLPIVGRLAIGEVQRRVTVAVLSAQHAYAVAMEITARRATLDAEAKSQAEALVVTSGFKELLARSQKTEDLKTKELKDVLAKAADSRRAAGDPCGRIDAARVDLLRKHGFTIVN